MRAISCALMGLLLVGVVPAWADTDPEKKKMVPAGVIAGPGYAFSILAPDGWTLDPESGKSSGLKVALYPEGSTWEDTRVFMYVHACARPSCSDSSYDEYVSAAVKTFRREQPTAMVAVGESISTADGKSAQVRSFSGDEWGNFEAVAYVEEDAVFAILVMSSKNQKIYEQSFEAFEDFVRSYHDVTDRLQKKD